LCCANPPVRRAPEFGYPIAFIHSVTKLRIRAPSISASFGEMGGISSTKICFPTPPLPQNLHLFLSSAS
jgi:hypothetical protein